MLTPTERAELLTAPQRRLLVDCVRHHRSQREMIQHHPRRVYNAYYAGGPYKQVARRLARVDLMSVDPYPRGGADIVPTELGCRVARECPEWHVLPFVAQTG